jgi:REP element-mobilizing transposase RayT
MARKRRVHIPNAYVHVSHRCNHGQPLFADPKVRALFLAVLDQVAAALGYEILYYCLQDNHIHLILFTPPAIAGHTLSTFMHRLDSAFGHRLNAWQGWQGTAWQGRYRATAWSPPQRLWVLELLLWYAATNTARRQVNAVPAADWRWGALYWLLRGERGPVRTTLRAWLDQIYRPRGCADPVAEFAALCRQTERPAWRERILELERAGLPWLGEADGDDHPVVRHDLKGLQEQIRALNLRSWKLEVERYSMLLLPITQVIY